MSFRFIHSSDFQIGKVFRFVDDATMGLLQDARVEAIARLGELAVEHDAKHILVAGDVYDKEALAMRSLNQPLERMRAFPSIQWHLLPGNHDPHRPNGLWDQLIQRGLPENVIAHINPEPTVLEEDTAVLLPAPLQHRHTLRDLTEYMVDVNLPDDVIRIGIAHGTITGFGSEGKDVPNFIDPDRPKNAHLSYLALGDWHGQRKINDRCWYSGTPEIDSFEVLNGGQALLVEIEGPNVNPVVTSVSTGKYAWSKLDEQINEESDVDVLVQKMRNITADPERMLISLTVSGALSLESRRYFQSEVADGVSAAFCFMRIDDQQLLPRPTVEDLNLIDRGGFVRTAAEELKELAEAGDEGSNVAADALQRLYIEHMKLQAEQR